MPFSYSNQKASPIRFASEINCAASFKPSCWAALGLATALGALAPAAQAAFVVTASYNLGTSSPVGATVVSASACGNGADALEFTGAGSNNIGIHTYACDFGGLVDFGSRSSGEGTYFVDGSMTYTGVVSGNQFNFHVNGGEVGAFGSAGFGAGEFQQSLLTMKIVIGGVTYFDDNWLTRVDAGGVVTADYTSNGSAGFLFSPVAGSGPYAQYNIFDFTYSIGGLTDGADISYVITSQASGNVVNAATCRAPNSDGGGIEIGIDGGGPVVALASITDAVNEGPVDDSYNAYCGAGARSGDPFGPGIARATPVPEPASLALVGLALLGLGASRRAARRG